MLNTCKSNGDASLLRWISGERVSNTWATCPETWDNTSKDVLIPDTHSAGIVELESFSVWDGPAAYQLVGEVMAHQGDDG